MNRACTPEDLQRIVDDCIFLTKLSASCRRSDRKYASGRIGGALDAYIARVFSDEAYWQNYVWELMHSFSDAVRSRTASEAEAIGRRYVSAIGAPEPSSTHEFWDDLLCCYDAEFVFCEQDEFF